MSKRKTYKPVFGQHGKDCTWEPMPYQTIDLILKIGKITPNDVVMDLGSGDGRVLFAAAANFGARGIGIEYDHDLVIYSRNLAKKKDLADKIKFIEGDVHDADISEASLIILYLHPEPLKHLYPVLSKLKPGTRIVSYLWRFDNWEPDFKLGVEKDRSIFLWILPKILKETATMH